MGHERPSHFGGDGDSFRTATATVDAGGGGRFFRCCCCCAVVVAAAVIAVDHARGVADRCGVKGDETVARVRRENDCPVG